MSGAASTTRPSRAPIRLRRLRSPVGQQAWVPPTAAFETTFSMLPTEGAEGGTSLGSNANSLIASGAVTAGAADGNAAVSISGPGRLTDMARRMAEAEAREERK